MTGLEQTTRVVDDIRTFFDTTHADPEALSLDEALQAARRSAVQDFRATP